MVIKTSRLINEKQTNIISEYSFYTNLYHTFIVIWLYVDSTAFYIRTNLK